MQAQTIVSRNIDPIEGGVVTFGMINGGIAKNVIAGEVIVQGTIRSMTQTGMEVMVKSLQRIAKGIAATYDVDVDVELNQGGYLPVYNNPELYAEFKQTLVNDKNINFVEVQPAMIGEDFGFLINNFPGVMFWLGANDPKHPLHSDKLNLDESAIADGVYAVKTILESR
jgi:N-acetyldiaminopimelate deacetylase